MWAVSGGNFINVMPYFMSLSCLAWVGWGISVPGVWDGGWEQSPGGSISASSGRLGPTGLQRAPGTGRLKTQLKAALIELVLGRGGRRRPPARAQFGLEPGVFGQRGSAGVGACGPGVGAAEQRGRGGPTGRRHLSLVGAAVRVC